MTETAVILDPKRPVILCVDDEPSILSALRRLFRTQGFQVLAAESGQAGLDILESASVDLVISDMRMPQMDGVVFLEHVRARKPDVPRLLLTGYADIASIAGAINRGEIYRYIAKPWDDNDIVMTVRDALERSALVQEKQRLETLVRAKNDELTAINTSLELRVEARTAELKQSNLALNAANEKLKNNFLTSIKMFTALIELRDGKLAGHTRRVADISRKLAVALELDNKQIQEIFVAGLLHAIGKVGFDDALLQTPFADMTPRQLEIYRKHPARAEQLLMPLVELKSPVAIIGAQLERFDGTGYPHGTEGGHIAMGARILAVAIAYDSLLIGVLEPRQFSHQEARLAIRQRSGQHFDPKVVQVFLEVYQDFVQNDLPSSVASSKAVKSHELLAGMVLSSDLTSPSGLLLLTAGHELDDTVIEKIVSFERSTAIKLTVNVCLGEVSPSV